MGNLLSEFKVFLLRGNIIELAVAIVIGIAFGAVVTAFVEDLVTPLVAAIFGEPDFSGLTFTINGSVFRYGSFINAILSFMMIAAAVFFFVVKPLSSRGGFLSDPSIRECPECLSEIPAAARRCKYCGSVISIV